MDQTHLNDTLCRIHRLSGTWQLSTSARIICEAQVFESYRTVQRGICASKRTEVADEQMLTYALLPFDSTDILPGAEQRVGLIPDMVVRRGSCRFEH
jgi:hypothetical protein